MSWSTGSSLFSDIIGILQEQVPDDRVREEIYEELIRCFWNDYDCDTLDECQGDDKAFDRAFKDFVGDEENDEMMDEEDNDRGC